MIIVCDCKLCKNTRTKFFKDISDIVFHFSELGPEQKFVMFFAMHGIVRYLN